LIFGSIVLAAKSPTFNLIMLHIYFLPVMLICLTLFIATICIFESRWP
jgi:hypothetical protein